MAASQFTERMAAIRARFAGKLPKKIEETDAELPVMAGDGATAVFAVAAAYRRFHEVCGIGPTVGFQEVGRAARMLVDSTLVKPFRAKRGLTTVEMQRLREGLEALKVAAQIEMHSTTTHRSI
jgi:hypothetical protein